MTTNWILFCDLDGVMADFDKGLKQVTGKAPGEEPLGRMWKALAHHGDFFYSLDFMPDAMTLWAYIKPHNPIILSGVPHGKWAHGQKKRWVGERLGWDVPVVLGLAKDKPENAMKFIGTNTLKDCILIDDKEKAKLGWINAGGTFILHTSTANTIKQLKALGI